MIDLFEKAHNNALNIEAEFSQVKAENPNIEAIAEKIQSKSHVSTNRNYRAIIEFLKTSRLPSGYHHLQEFAERHGRKIDNEGELYKSLQRHWPDADMFYIRRRIEFLKTFKQGEYHLFGALNAGGYGAAAQNGAYGEYCIVFKKEIFNKLKDVAYCKMDTLDYDKYWKCDDKSSLECPGARKNCRAKQHPKKDQLNYLTCQINFDKLYSHYAPHSHRGRLAVIKHKNDVVKADWNIKDIIKPREGRTEDYIEVCFVLPVTLDDVEEIRIHPEILCRIFDEICIDEKDLDGKASILEFHKKTWDLIEEVQKKGKIHCDFPWKDSD